MNDLALLFDFVILVGRVHEAMGDLFLLASEHPERDVKRSLDFRPSDESMSIHGFVDTERPDGGFVSHGFEILCSKNGFWIECERRIHDGIDNHRNGGRSAVECHTFPEVAVELGEVANWFRDERKWYTT